MKFTVVATLSTFISGVLTDGTKTCTEGEVVVPSVAVAILVTPPVSISAWVVT